MFAAVVLVAHATNHHSALSIIGAYVYFWGRIGYLVAAALGSSLIRSVLFWNAALTGILLLIAAPFVE